MRPLDDWMELKLWEPQAAAMDVRIAIPDTVEREKDEAAVFEVLKVGKDVSTNKESEVYGRVRVGDIVQLVGYGSIAKIKLPNGRYTLVGQAKNVCFIMEPVDLQKEEDERGRIELK